MKDTVTKSWFAVLNNPFEHGYEGTPEEVCYRLRDEWLAGGTERTGAWAFCVSADGLRHVHMVLEDVKAMRFSAVKMSYAAGTHFEATKGKKSRQKLTLKSNHLLTRKASRSFASSATARSKQRRASAVTWTKSLLCWMPV